jgi:drug/metabolite transporter (DMT)-like permease
VTAPSWVVAVPLAVGAAAAFGGAGLLQHHAAQEAPESGPLNPRLLRDLLRVRGFVWGIVFSAIGFLLQVAALRFAPLAVVQPLLVTGVLFYLGFARIFLHHTIDAILVTGALMALVGLSGFLLAAQPSAGSGRVAGAGALALGVALLAVVALCLALSQRLDNELRALPFAVATAACYGTTAGLLRSLLLSDLSQLFKQWQLYAVVVVAPAGFLLNQNAFQEGRLGSVSVATINVGDPVVAILIGTVWLGDRIAGGPLRTTAEILLLALMAAGVLLLAGRAQRVADRLRRLEDAEGQAQPG